ncbi:MAG: peptide chain release factor N(5)-glutamine methyltransferase [Parachlamydiaceae bacterium]|nr:peptide chain release factor N(5)-glutamine methyltransferase [Parachlamydiaceae bacterium]
MKIVREFLKEATECFSSLQFTQARRQSEDLLCDLLSCSRLQLYMQLDYPLTELELEKAKNWLQRRAQGEPLAYIHGKIDFYGCTIEVNPSVLIPRQETEILVDKVVQSLKKQDLKGKIFVDLCCGSGCIGTAVKKKFPELTVYLSDISAKAIQLAKRNAALNQVELFYLEGDLLEPFIDLKFDYLVCNPPYISKKEYANLENEVKEFEPSLALIGGESGLEFYQRLSKELPHYLNSKSQIWMEIGYAQGEDIKKIFNSHGWVKKTVENDWAGHDRFFFLENE